VRDADAVTACVQAFDTLDVVVNCAGVIRRGAEHDPEVFAQVLDINLNGTMRVCAAARPLLAARRGCIVNTASMLSFFGGGLVPGYSASKGGVAQLTKSPGHRLRGRRRARERRAMSKTDRVYKIEMLIRNRGHVSFATLLEELEVSPATLKRDLEYLRDRWVRRSSTTATSTATASAPSTARTAAWPEARAAGPVVQRARAVQPADGHQLLSELDTKA
jgi:hypothetical protein